MPSYTVIIVTCNKAVEELFPLSDIQRCTKHRTENVLNKVLKEDRAVVKESIRRIFYASTYEHAKEAIELFKRDWGRKYPSASGMFKGIHRSVSDLLQVSLQALEEDKSLF